MKKKLSVALVLLVLAVMALSAACAEIVTYIKAQPISFKYYMQDPNKLKVQFEVKNTGNKTISGFDYCVYAEDKWGERVYGSDYVYTQHTSTKIQPGDSKWSEYVIVPGRRETEKLYVAIKSIDYTDGTYQLVLDSDLEYYWCGGPFAY